ncbi:MAG: hypothetical protein E6767_18825 [Dysgonomonas sp.]|nr:hypothetical protein [Dysgonomonas sp.]
MEREDLRFTTNWNNKLNCSCFTTLRLHNPKKYYVGAKKDVYLDNRPKGPATIIGVQSFLLEQISEFVARIDTGYSATDCKKIIKEMYKRYPLINWNTQKLDFSLIQYDSKEGKEHNLFNTENVKGHPVGK